MANEDIQFQKAIQQIQSATMTVSEKSTIHDRIVHSFVPSPKSVLSPWAASMFVASFVKKFFWTTVRKFKIKKE